MTELIQAPIQEHLKHLPGHILLALALNDSTPDRNRKAAVEIMVARGDAQAKDPSISYLLKEVLADAAAHNEVVDAVETAIEAQIEIPVTPKSLVAGVTTKTLAGE